MRRHFTTQFPLNGAVALGFSGGAVSGDGQRWVRVGTTVIDFASRAAERDGERIRLTRTELRILNELVEHRGQPVARERLLSTIWGEGAQGLSSRAVDVNIGRLRRKLEMNPASPSSIVTVSGYGYVLAEETLTA